MAVAGLLREMDENRGGTPHGISTRPVEPRWVVAAVAASGAGVVVHNLAEFPPAILVAPETLPHVAITLALGVGMLRRPGRGVFLETAAWGTIVVVVGGGSVLPLGIWPFAPDSRWVTTPPTWCTRSPRSRYCGSLSAAPFGDPGPAGRQGGPRVASSRF